MTKEEWDALDLNKVPCPKCGQTKGFWRVGMDTRRQHFRAICKNCKATSSDLQLQPNTTKAEAKPLVNGSFEQLILERLEKIEQRLGIATAKTKSFDLSQYTDGQQAKINQLVAIVKAHLDWGNIRLAKALRSELGSGLSKTDIVKVKNAVREGFFNV